MAAVVLLMAHSSFRACRGAPLPRPPKEAMAGRRFEGSCSVGMNILVYANPSKGRLSRIVYRKFFQQAPSDLQDMQSSMPRTNRESPRTAAPKIRREGPTRDRLVEAAIDLMRLQGASALTASAIARAAGIAQPNFYAY